MYDIRQEMDKTYRMEQFIEAQNNYAMIPDTANLTHEEAQNKLQELNNNNVVFKCNDGKYCIYHKNIQTRLFEKTTQCYDTEELARQQLNAMNDIARE
jgi:acetyl-CoA carboxylase beta subunit